MKRTEERTIEDTVYSVTQFIPTIALEYQLELMKLLGKPLAGLYASSEFSTTDKSTDEASFDDIKIDLEAGVSQLADAINPKKHTKFIKDMLSLTTANNRHVAKHFDDIFQGKIMEIYQVLLFVIEVNYPDFFTKISGALDKLPEIEQPPQQDERALEAV